VATFQEVYSYLLFNGSVSLPYASNENIIYTAIADTSSKGQRAGHQIIRIISGKQTNILIYADDWGNTYTKSGTLIAHIFDSLNPYIEQQLVKCDVSQKKLQNKTKIVKSIIFTHRILWNTVTVLKETAMNAANEAQQFHINLSIMLLLYFSLESYLNYLGETIDPQKWKNEKDFFRIEPYRETMGKLDYLMEKCHMQIDRHCRPYQTINKLHKIRTYLVHGKIKKSSTCVPLKQLKQRTDNKLPSAAKTFLDRDITEETTKKALEDVERIIKDLHLAALDNYSNKGLFQDPFMGILSSTHTY
jgi:hypothetical protein